MERTKIAYQKTADGCINITRIEGAATCEQLKEKYGEEVLRVYLGGVPRYVMEGCYIRHTFDIGCGGAKNEIVHVGSVLKKQEFSRLIKSLKDAGDRLARAIREVSEYEERIVEI